jgi:two-component system OmpR family response regulator
VGDQASFAGWRVDLARRLVVSPGGETVDLTAAEFKLLAVLVENPNRPLDRDQLLDAVGGRDWQPFDRSIDLHISHLRRKLEDDPRRPALIKTVRGEGYMLAAPVTRTSG